MPLASDNLYRVARFFLTNPDPCTLSTIAERTGVPRSSLTQLVRWLRYHRAVRARDGQYTADPGRMLDLLASARRPDVVPARTLTTDHDEAELSHVLDGVGVDHVLAYLTAANLHLFYQPERRIMVAVERGQATQARRVLTDGDQPVEIFERDMSHVHATTDPEGRRFTDLIETAIDVRAHPDGGPYATLLEEALAGRRQGNDDG